ncbi:hypothetical protein CFC21_049671 [Triticum aestivum]|uniref:Uncharacterized protein n=1 Tax=Triticum aestivum TaxID=4565 RepID=A0A9R1G4F9_WHEAT|nr:hypothetical protein CFC21_049671 [Triticum aestivum]
MHTARCVQFAEGGPDHEVSIGCSGGGGSAKEEELWVSVDGKRGAGAAAAAELQGEPDRVRGRSAGGRHVGPARLLVPGAYIRQRHGHALGAQRAGEPVFSLVRQASRPGFSLVLQAFKSRADGLSSAPAH